MCRYRQKWFRLLSPVCQAVRRMNGVINFWLLVIPYIVSEVLWARAIGHVGSAECNYLGCAHAVCIWSRCDDIGMRLQHCGILLHYLSDDRPLVTIPWYAVLW